MRKPPPKGQKFKLGQSGNPAGRPKVDPAVKDLAKAHTVLAVDTLAEVCRNKKAPAASRVAAAVALLDRGHGKPGIDAEGAGVAVYIGEDIVAVHHARAPGAHPGE